MAHYREVEKDISRDYLLADGGIVTKFHSGKALITIAETKNFGPMLFMDGVLQLASADEYIYHEMLVHPIMSSVKNPKRVCIFGGADGCTAREVLRYNSVEYVDLVDWDENLIVYLKEKGRMWHQGSLLDPRVHIHTMNVLDFKSSEKYDVIIVDLFDPEYNDFNENGIWSLLVPILKNLLASGGSIVINGGGVLPWKYGTFERLYIALGIQITKNTMIPYKVFVPSFTEEWAFLLLSDKAPLITENVQHRYCGIESFGKACMWEKPYKAFSKN